MRFDEATAVVASGSDTYSGEIQPGWDIVGITNGGYLMTMSARAMGQESPGRDLVSISAHFLSPARPGPVTIGVETLKVGRGISTLRAELRSDDKPLVTAIASFADPNRQMSDEEMFDSAPPDLPPPDGCVRAESSQEAFFPPPFVDRVEMLLHPDDAALFSGDPAGVARIRGWLRLLDGEQSDAYGAVMASDALPPAIFNANLPVNWTPTLDMTVHVRDPKPREWLRLEVRTKYVTGGLLEEDGEIWDEEGNLVAHSRQLALVPR